MIGDHRTLRVLFGLLLAVGALLLILELGFVSRPQPDILQEQEKVKALLQLLAKTPDFKDLKHTIDNEADENKKYNLVLSKLRQRYESKGREDKDTVSLLVVLWNEIKSFRNSLQTWKDNGLFKMVNESILYIQERNEEKAAVAHEYHNFAIIGTAENTNINNALDASITAANSEYVLFMEKDWMLVEGFETVQEQINKGVELLKTGVADVVRFRSRMKPGFPNYADLYWKGKEGELLQKQPYLFCNTYHWIVNPELDHPDKFWICNESPRFYCSTSKYCNWSNNPFLIRKSWWMEKFSSIARQASKDHPYSFENSLVTPAIWTGQGYKIAFGDGLFQHKDIDKYGDA